MKAAFLQPWLQAELRSSGLQLYAVVQQILAKGCSKGRSEAFTKSGNSENMKGWGELGAASRTERKASFP